MVACRLCLERMCVCSEFMLLYSALLGHGRVGLVHPLCMVVQESVVLYCACVHLRFLELAFVVIAGLAWGLGVLARFFGLGLQGSRVWDV